MGSGEVKGERVGYVCVMLSGEERFLGASYMPVQLRPGTRKRNTAQGEK